MLKVLILEDDIRIRQYLNMLVRQTSYIVQIFDTDDGQEAIEIAIEEKPEIALLDIGLCVEDEMNGLEVAKKIDELVPGTNFIFVTAYSEFALESFAVHPHDFIVKPIDKKRFLSTLKKLANRLIKEKDRKLKDQQETEKRKFVLIEAKKELLRISFEQINIIEKEKQGKRLLIHTNTKTYQTTKTLQDIEKELDSRFIRVHRSFVVNKDKIVRISEGDSPRSYTVELAGTDKTAVMSRYRLEEVKKALK